MKRVTETTRVLLGYSALAGGIEKLLAVGMICSRLQKAKARWKNKRKRRKEVRTSNCDLHVACERDVHAMIWSGRKSGGKSILTLFRRASSSMGDLPRVTLARSCRGQTIIGREEGRERSSSYTLSHCCNSVDHRVQS